jgi:hypothetical protein
MNSYYVAESGVKHQKSNHIFRRGALFASTLLLIKAPISLKTIDLGGGLATITNNMLKVLG